MRLPELNIFQYRDPYVCVKNGNHNVVSGDWVTTVIKIDNNDINSDIHSNISNNKENDCVHLFKPKFNDNDFNSITDENDEILKDLDFRNKLHIYWFEKYLDYDDEHIIIQSKICFSCKQSFPYTYGHKYNNIITYCRGCQEYFCKHHDDNNSCYGKYHSIQKCYK